MSDKQTVSFPVRLPQELDAKLNAAAELLDLSKQALMRLCLGIGLEHIRRCDYDLASAILDATHGPHLEKPHQSAGQAALPLAAEDPPEKTPEGSILPLPGVQVSYRTQKRKK